MPERYISEAKVVDALRTVYDGCCEERGISIVDMGLVDEVRVIDGQVHVQMVLTTGWCPFATRMLTEARRHLSELPGIRAATIEVSWDKAWDATRLDARLARKLRLLPEPGQVPDRDAFVAQAARPVSKIQPALEVDR